MADDKFLDLGIEDTSTLDKVGEDFFSGDAEELEKIEKKPSPAPAPPEKKEEKTEEKEEIKFDPDKELFGDDEEKDEEKREDEEKSPEEKEEEKKEFNQFEALSKELYNMGVFIPDVNDKGEEEMPVANTPEEFASLFQSQIDKSLDKKLQNFLVNKHGDEGVRTFEAIYINGVDPKEYFTAYNEIQDLQNVNIEEESAQELVVREFYKRAGVPEDKINKKIQKLKDTADLHGEAEDYLPQLIEQSKEALAQKEEGEKLKAQKAEHQDRQYKAAITKILNEKLKEKEFNGLPLNEKTVQEAFDKLYTKKWVAPNGEKLTDLDVWWLESKKPENISNRILLSLLVNSGFDFSKIEKKAESKASNKFFSNFAEKKTPSKISPAKQPATAGSWPL